jgi:hypothetical protein
MLVLKMPMILTMSYLSSHRLRTQALLSRRSAMLECQWLKLWLEKVPKLELTGMLILLCSGTGLYRPKIKSDGPLGSGLEVLKTIRKELQSRMHSNCLNSQMMTIFSPYQTKKTRQTTKHKKRTTQTIKLITRMIQLYLQKDTNLLIQFMSPT